MVTSVKLAQEFSDVWLSLLIAVPLSIVGKVFSGGIAGKINGFSRRASLNIGFGSVSRGSSLLSSQILQWAPDVIYDRIRSAIYLDI